MPRDLFSLDYGTFMKWDARGLHTLARNPWLMDHSTIDSSLGSDAGFEARATSANRRSWTTISNENWNALHSAVAVGRGFRRISLLQDVCDPSIEGITGCVCLREGCWSAAPNRAS